MTDANMKTDAFHRRREESDVPDAPRTTIPNGLAYESPRLVRVRVETARMAAGLQTAVDHCTQHFHQNIAGCPV